MLRLKKCLLIGLAPMVLASFAAQAQAARAGHWKLVKQAGGLKPAIFLAVSGLQGTYDVGVAFSARKWGTLDIESDCTGEGQERFADWYKSWRGGEHHHQVTIGWAYHCDLSITVTPGKGDGGQGTVAASVAIWRRS
jgi:hypothetical protein